MTFCPYCGVRIKSDAESPQHPEAETNNQKLCSQCGFVSEASLGFCGSCGKEFEDSNEISPEPPSLEDLKEKENMK